MPATPDWLTPLLPGARLRVCSVPAVLPADARAAKAHGFLKADHLTPQTLAQIQKLNDLAQSRGQSLAQMALAWTVRDPRVTTALIGASKVSQLEDNFASLQTLDFSADELAAIDTILSPAQ